MERDLDIVLERIMRSDARDWNDILLAVIRRHKMLYPDWELWPLTLPAKDLRQRERDLEAACEYIKQIHQK